MGEGDEIVALLSLLIFEIIITLSGQLVVILERQFH